MTEQLDIFGGSRPFAALSGEVLKQSGIKKVSANNRESVSYTHLTLPTLYSV